MRTKITKGAMDLQSLYLPAEFIRQNQLRTGQKYDIHISGLDTNSLSEGTLQASGLIGGFAAMYKAFPDLEPASEVEIELDGQTINVTPPGQASTVVTASTNECVLDRKNSRRVFIEPYAHGAINRWKPKGEPDVYMVFGRLAEFTPYSYCCATSKEILDKLGISIEPKPDALLVEEGTGRYLIAEFEVMASSFIQHQHKKDDIDVLVCWQNDLSGEQQSQLPMVLCLEDLITNLLAEGELDL